MTDSATPTPGTIHYNRPPPPKHPNDRLAAAKAKLDAYDATFDVEAHAKLNRTMTGRQRQRFVLEVEAAEQSAAARRKADAATADLSPAELAARIRR